MRQFLLFTHEATTDPDFSLDDLPGAGRMDLIARSVTSAFLLSHDIRTDVNVRIVLGDAITVRLEGSELQGLHPDERSTAALLRQALTAQSETVGHQAVESSPGVYVSRHDRSEALAAVADAGPLVWLHPDGKPVAELDSPTDPVFVLSDHRAFTAEGRERIEEVVDAKVRLGPRPLHTDQAITVAHNYLDTAGYQRY